MWKLPFEEDIKWDIRFAGGKDDKLANMKSNGNFFHD